MKGQKAPAFLTTSGKRRFQTLAKQVKNPTETQVQMIGLLAQCWEGYLMALKDVNEKGMSVLSGVRLFKNPSVEMMVKERKSILDLSIKLGLVPDVKPENQKTTTRSPLEGLLNPLVMDD